MRQRIAVLGGTFDPVHNGHLAVIDQVIASTGADAGYLVPSYLPAHRAAPIAPAATRLEMVRAAVRDKPRVTTDDIEIVRGGYTYTLDTLRQWRRLAPKTQFDFIVGADAARSIGTWHAHEELLREGWFVIVNRFDSPPIGAGEAASLGFDPARTQLVSIDSPPVCASDIRRRVAAHEPIDAMVPAAVLAIIERDHLYQTAGIMETDDIPRAH